VKEGFVMENIENNKNQIQETSNNSTALDKKITLEELNQQYLQEQLKQGKTVSEIATDFAKAKTTNEIINNEDGEYDKLHKELAEEQKETLKEGFKQDKLKSQTDTLTAKQKKAEAFYIANRPILEFDFGNLVKKEKNKNNNEEEKPPKKYEDRSYGIPLMVLMLCLFVIPYCGVSLLLAVFNGINAIFEAISTFGKIAKTIVLSLCFMAIVLLVVYCALMGIDTLFGTNIIKGIGL
jgi:hypothetical protein